MRKWLLSLFALLIMSGSVFAQSKPDIIKGKVWNRWTSNNFSVHAITDDQGRYLKNNLEGVKNWVLTRWGLNDIKFDVDVKLWCVGDRELFEALYPSLDNSKVEVRRADGKVKVVEAFLLLDDQPSRVLPGPITEICVALFEEQHNVKFGWWAYRGMILLNGSETQIRARLRELSPAMASGRSVFLSKTMFSTKKADYAELTDVEKVMFDNEAMVLCLLLRKEFGQARLLHFLKEADPEKGLKDIYGFRSYDHFDASYYRYMKDLVRDLIEGKTPSHYLLIQKAGK
tara:strand:- start:3170 stop:4027 length:858 start_codon:yes stop_codon:yes gene_type:complete